MKRMLHQARAVGIAQGKNAFPSLNERAEADKASLAGNGHLERHSSRQWLQPQLFGEVPLVLSSRRIFSKRVDQLASWQICLVVGCRRLSVGVHLRVLQASPHGYL